MSPAKRMYEPRIFEGRVMVPEEQEQIYEEIIQFERMEYVSPQMRELIMDVWPELAHKGAVERGLNPLLFRNYNRGKVGTSGWSRQPFDNHEALASLPWPGLPHICDAQHIQPAAMPLVSGSS